MRFVARAPASPTLRLFVQRVWASASEGVASSTASLERVLPTGCMHLVMRVSSTPLTIYEDESGRGEHVIGLSVVGGARSTAYVREVTSALRTVGVMLAPGAAPRLFGMPASQLAESHTSLDDLWGRDAAILRERLAACRSLDAQLALVENALEARLAGVERIDPVVSFATARFHTSASIASVVARTGYSHRAFIARFRAAVGLSPKTYCRVTRTQRALTLLPDPRRSLAEIATSAGYSDQSHLTREFSAIVGLTPANYRAANPIAPNHVPVGATSNSFKTRRAR